MPSEIPAVLITGGSQGLGYALAHTLLTHGFAVAICARDQCRLEQAAVSLSAYGHVLAVAADIGDADQREMLVKRVVDEFGRLDALVNNASTLGTLPLPTVDAADIENFRQVFHINTFAPILLLKRCLPWLESGAASIAMSISSDAAVAGYPNWGVYGASKAAADLLMKTFANERHDRSALAVYTVDPGDMDTALHRCADPDATGLPAPTSIAPLLLALFDPLRAGTHHPEFPSGTRFSLADGTLKGVL